MGCLNGKLDKENEDEKSRREANKKIEKQLQKDKQMYRATHRLLLLGHFLVSVVFYEDRTKRCLDDWLEDGTVLTDRRAAVMCPIDMLYGKLACENARLQKEGTNTMCTCGFADLMAGKMQPSMRTLSAFYPRSWPVV